MRLPKISRPLWGWAFYDFANTIFSAIILTSFFPLYFTGLAGSNKALGLTTTSVMLLSGLALPFLGALSDRTGKTKIYLIRSTCLSVLFVILLSAWQNVGVLILCYGAACFFYHASLVFYNSLLPAVAAPKEQGFASGLGTGLGYLGVVFSLPIAAWIGKHFGDPFVFTVCGVLFFIFSLPLFFYVPERSVRDPLNFHFSLWKSEWKKVFNLLQKIKSQPPLLAFFLGNFFVVDALNTMIFWFSVYAREMFHPSRAALVFLLLGVNFSAFMMGILAGLATDKLGAMKTFLLSSALLMLTLVALAAAPTLISFIFVSTLGGAATIAGIWTAGRKALLELAPPEETGEFFGLYGLTTKISVIGNFVFSIVADAAGMKPALQVLLLPASAGFLCLIVSYFTLTRKN